MENRQAIASLKKQMTDVMGRAAEIHERMPDEQKPIMDMVRAQITATYTALLISEGILFPASEMPKKRKYGEYGWVKLTDPQHEALTKRYGKELLERAIKYIDESAQQNGNKNKWKDWALVIHKCIREDWGKVRSAAPKAAAGEQLDDMSLRIIENFMKGTG